MDGHFQELKSQELQFYLQVLQEVCGWVKVYQKFLSCVMQTFHSPFVEWHIGVEIFTWFAPDHQLTCKVVTVEQKDMKNLR